TATFSKLDQSSIQWNGVFPRHTPRQIKFLCLEMPNLAGVLLAFLFVVTYANYADRYDRSKMPWDLRPVQNYIVLCLNNPTRTIRVYDYIGVACCLESTSNILNGYLRLTIRGEPFPIEPAKDTQPIGFRRGAPTCNGSIRACRLLLAVLCQSWVTDGSQEADKGTHERRNIDDFCNVVLDC
ncbi:hypothetical protein OSTOST_07069, partial [Ostertagia ostertagi]